MPTPATTTSFLTPAAILAERTSPGELFLTVGLLVLSVIIGTVVVLAMRRRWMAKEKAEATSVGLMESMRTMLRDGRISQAEFDAAKAGLATRLRGQPGPTAPDRSPRNGSSAIDAAIDNARRREGRGRNPPDSSGV
ncbi:MAG: hypothetical protein ACT4PL_03515 [Phycisphaerales bacterium]